MGFIDGRIVTDTDGKSITEKISNLSKSPNQYEWTTTEGQLIYTLPDGTEYDHNSKWLEVTVGGAPVPSDMISKDSSSQFTLLTDAAKIPSGVKVVAKWIESYVPATSGHKNIHEKDGYDAIDVRNMLGFEEGVVEPLVEITYLFQPLSTGSNADTDTAAIQDAINQAKSLEIKTLKFPKGKTFLIKADAGTDGRGAASIVVPSHLDIDLNGSTLQIETNGYQGYQIFGFDKDARFSVIRNGILKGDKATHDYTTIEGTHEWGRGVHMYGYMNRIEKMEIHNFTGDGIYFTGYRNQNWDGRLFSDSFTVGSLKSDGTIDTDNTTSITSSLLDINNYTENKATNILVEPYYGTNPLEYERVVAIAFYNSSTLIQIDRRFVMSEIVVPAEATHFRISFDQSDIDFDTPVFIYGVLVGKNNTIAHCEIHNNRRQGISASRSEHGLITDTVIHDIGGVSPGAGIDIEDSRLALRDLTIRRTTIYNTANAPIVYYEGIGVTIDDCLLITRSENNEIGAIHTQYGKNLTVRNSTLYGMVTIGDQQLDTSDLFNLNTFDNNIVVNNSKESQKKCAFRNTVVSNSSFTNLDVNSYGHSYFEDCLFDDIRAYTGYYEMSVNGDFRRCEFNVKYSSSGYFKGTGNFTDNCTIKASGKVKLYNVKKLKDITIDSNNYEIETSLDSIAEIKRNTYVNQSNTTMGYILRNNAIIEENHYKPADANYILCTITGSDNCEIVKLRDNQLEAGGGSLRAFGFKGSASYTVLTEGNLSNVAGIDFVFRDGTDVETISATIKSKDDIFNGSNSTDTRVVRSETVYS